MKININDFRYKNCNDCSGCRSCRLPQDLEGCAAWRDYLREKLNGLYIGKTNFGIAYNPPRVFENKIQNIIIDWNNQGKVLIVIVDRQDNTSSWIVSPEEYFAWQNFYFKESAEIVLKCWESENDK